MSNKHKSSDDKTTKRDEETAQTWLQRIIQTQLTTLTPPERRSIQDRANAQRALQQQSIEYKKVEYRARVSKECTKRQMMTVSASAPNTAQTLREEQRRMVEEEIAMSRECNDGEDVSEDVMHRLNVMASTSIGPPSTTHRPPPQLQLRDRPAVIVDDVPLIAPLIECTTTDEEVLASLRQEPTDEASCAEKFKAFELFSATTEKVRKSLFDLVEQKPLPVGGAREEMQHFLKKLDSNECCGIFDQSRYWFVHDMMAKTMENTKKMEQLTRDVNIRLGLLAQNAQTQCPICLDDYAANEDEEGSDVTPFLLPCCHTVCRMCWVHWCNVNPHNKFCPVCKHEAFLDFLTAHSPQ